MLKKSKITIVLILVVSFLMNSCHKEEELESIDIQTAIKKRNISFEELNTKLNKYKKYKVHQGRAGGDEFITSLETDNIVEIATEDKTTYTLKANTTADDATSFTNIIFIEKNGQLEKYLLKYEPTEAWKTAQLTDANISYSGDNIILDFDGNILAESQVVDGVTVSKTSASMTCYEFEWYSDVINLESYYIIVEVPCDEPTDTEIDAGDSGDGGGTDTSGDGDGSTTSGTGTDGDSSNDNSTGDTADTGDDGDPIFTEPVFDDNECTSTICQLDGLICNDLSTTEINLISENNELAQQIYNQLSTNSSQGECSDINLVDLFSFFANNESSYIDFDAPSSILQIESLDEIDTFFNNLLNSNNVEFELVDNQNGEHNTIFINHFPYVGLAIEIHVISNLERPFPLVNPNPYELVGVDSFLTSTINLGTDWTQSSAPIVVSVNDSNNTATITVVGVMKQTLGFKGLSISTSKTFTFTLILNTITGDAINMSSSY